jgi:hypothetical protein
MPGNLGRVDVGTADDMASVGQNLGNCRQTYSSDPQAVYTFIIAEIHMIALPLMRQAFLLFSGFMPALIILDKRSGFNKTVVVCLILYNPERSARYSYFL